MLNPPVSRRWLAGERFGLRDNGRLNSKVGMTPDFDLSKLSHAEKDALILSLAAQLQTALARIAELERRLAASQVPPRTLDNSSLPPSTGENAELALG